MPNARFVDTKLSQWKADTILSVKPSQCVNGTLNDLGYERETFGHWLHKIQGYISDKSPDFMAFLLFGVFRKMNGLEIKN